MGAVAVANEATAMHNSATLAIAFMFFLAPTFGQAHDDLAINGEELLGWCKPQKVGAVHELIGSRCYGFLSGAIEGNRGDLAVRGFECCPNHHVTAEEIRNIFVSWIEKRPERRREDARDLVGRALSDAFPCNHAKRE